MSQTAIWWLRRDLRLEDNQALQAALEAAESVIPVFVLDPRLLGSSYASEMRSAFLFAGLHSLDESLRERGGRLIVRQGDPLAELSHLREETGAQVIYAEPDYSPYAAWRDRQVEEALPVHWVGSSAIRPPGTVLRGDGAPYTVFTPFSKAWKALPEMRLTARRSQARPLNTPVSLASLPIPTAPTLPSGVPFKAGEAAAREQLEDFLSGMVYGYTSGRNQLDSQATSGLSPYLRFGMLAPQRAASEASRAIAQAPEGLARTSAETWLNELIWRDFFMHILQHYPRVRRENFRLPNVRWRNNPEHFQAWCAGQTGYPVVDAAQRALLAEGWMHNRARMITASFLTKDLLIDWRWGERWFMQHLIDGDPAANNGGWQWTAGTGTDAAPYFRIFNPVSQGIKHDPRGAYVRRWVPELRDVPDEYIHEPWKMPADLQRQVGVTIGQDYPAPLVEHAQARALALEAYKANG